MKANTRKERTCPLCGCIYTAPPAISRQDNTTPICPDCGTREALATIGVGGDEANRILGIIRKATREEGQEA